ncbi:hypothetical protein [Lacrimispora sp.]|uniref:hypothetical protein n=1 Tax=Lacrimispora sp. TaxID=2719234 RepID=UPI0032E46CE2
MVKLEAYSYTIIMDRFNRDRSFQQESNTYGGLVRSILSPYQAAYIWNCEGRDEPVGRFLMQYQESDWEFLRRLASLYGHPIIPEVRFPGAKMFIGLPAGRKAQPLTAEQYRIKKSLEKTCRNLDNKTTGGLSEGLEIEIKDRYENYFLGDIIEFLKVHLVVTAKKSYLKGGQWVHDYSLRPSVNCKMERMDNLKLAGAAIPGRVLGTSLTSTMLALDTDIGEGTVESWHVQPVYYAGGGKGYSGQPEKGDGQYLFFPTMREEDRYILGGADAGEERIASIVDKASSEEKKEELKRKEVSAGGDGQATSQPLSKTKSWTTPGNQKLILNGSGVSLSNKKQTRVSVNGSGIHISSSGNLTLETGDILGYGKKIEMNAKEYVWINCEESGILLLPDTVHMKAEEIYIESPKNLPHEIVKEDAVEEILGIYEKSKKSVPPIYASDGSIIRREGYDDILFSEELFHYFEENVYGKGDYENPIGQPVLNFYDSWLDETYGKSKLKKFWEHMSTLDGFQDMLNVAGIVFDGADLLNCFIYACRGNGKEAVLSLICTAPLIGDLIGKGGKAVMGASTDLALKLGKDGKKIVEGLELVYKTSSDGAAFLRKHIDDALDLLSSGMHGEDGYRLAFAGGGYFDDAGKITFSIVDDAGNASSYVRYIDDVMDGANRSARDGSVKVAAEGAGDAIKGGSKSSAISVTEATPPGSSHPVKVYTDGNAQINTGKIDTYIRGNIKEPSNYGELKQRINDLKKIQNNNPSEFTKTMKKELIAGEKTVHNYERSKGMGELLNDAGIVDTPKNNEMIAKSILNAAKEVTPENTKIVSYIKGTNKTVLVESWWIIDSDGIPYCSTIILKAVK